MQTSNQLLHALTREGVLIHVSIRFWRGCKKLRPEDLGLKASQLSDRLVSLGHKRLVSKEALSCLLLAEGRARSLIELNTFPFLNGLSHFLPNGRLAEVTGRLKELEQEFWKAKQEFAAKYSSLRSSASAEWRQMAQKLVSDPERLVRAIEASFPSAQLMERSFGFDMQLFQISLPENLSLDLVTLADQEGIVQARDNAAREAGRKIRQDTEAFVSDCIAALREQTAALCEEMLRSINSSETGVHQKTLNRLIRFIDQFKQMNFANDRIMEEQLDQVRRELLTRTAEEYRDSARARQALTNGLSLLADKARELAKTDASHLVQRFGELGKRKFNLAA